jgi:glycine/D-amino acid oxidase-like deaminating enzyme
MASAGRIVIAGAGAVGASVAYHLARLGARDVVLTDVGEVAGGQTSKALGGVRQQFSTAAEVRLARASIRFFEELGPPFFLQVGYLFLATTEPGLQELRARMRLQEELGVAVRELDAVTVTRLAPGTAVDDVLGAVYGEADGLADPPAVTREVARRAAELGVVIREGTDARSLDAEIFVIACGPDSLEVGRALGAELPIRPLCRQLLETEFLPGLPEELPLVIETETGFHYRRRGDRLVLAMSDERPRWDVEPTVDTSVYADRLERLAHRYPRTAGTSIGQAWAGLYDMTPDAHPIVGRVGSGIYAACGFSGHGFMQSPAVGRSLAEEIYLGESTIDLSPYRLERFVEGAVFPETVVL